MYIKDVKYDPKTPRNIAIWAVVQAYGNQGRNAVVDAIVASGVVDSREWNSHNDPRKQAEAHVGYLERNAWAGWK